ncbi:MAG: hypothetical protein Q8880_07125 [Bacteroidota bacterium]|nr:hypothetical protein [Bacteroidota bacterium]
MDGEKRKKVKPKIKKVKVSFLTIILVISYFIAYPQAVYEHISNSKIYDFLDELSNQKIISINSAIKPYTRLYIAQKLHEAENKIDQLNKRQQNELTFFLKDYNKELLPDKKFKKRLDLFYYKDSLFSCTINPIYGINIFTNENGHVYHRWEGAEAFGYLGKNIGMYASLRDNHESQPLERPAYLTLRTGAPYKSPADDGSVDYDEMRGGITYSNKWLTIGMIKDHFVWGNNYNGSNIFSGRTPSIPQIQFCFKPVKWLTLNYVHGWLASNIVDSAASYNYNSGSRIVYREKLLTANMITITPLKYLNISFGNSVIYSDMGTNIAYLMPFFFYNSIDHTYASANPIGNNSQMYFDISSRQIKGLHLFTSVFIDEISISNMWKPDKQSNFVSGKFGLNFSKINNFNFIAEYIATNPITYRHFIPTLTFQSDLYNLGHYLTDNSQEIFLSLKYKPIRGLNIQISYTNAEHGKEYPYTGTNNTGKGLPFLSTIEWKNEAIALNIDYQVINGGYLFAGYTLGKTSGNVQKYSPPLFRGKTNTISMGFNYGF